MFKLIKRTMVENQSNAEMLKAIMEQLRTMQEGLERHETRMDAIGETCLRMGIGIREFHPYSWRIPSPTQSRR